MTACTPDTSGIVRGPFNVTGYLDWEDLTPFAQGYVRAALTPGEWSYFTLTSRHAGFSDLSPEALAAMIADCERRQAELVPSMGRTTRNGSEFWAQRQRGGTGFERFPPLTLSLRDDGKISTAVAS